MKKKILLLGASSSIGSNLLYEDKKNLIQGIIRKPFKSHSKIKKKRLRLVKKKIKLINPKNIKKIGKFDVIINCIGITKNFNNNKFNLNLNKKKFFQYSNYILNIIEVTNCKIFIHLGSSMEYSGLKNFSERKIDENSNLIPQTKYGKFKVFENNFFKKKLKKTNTKLFFIKLFSIYGHLLKKNSLMHILIYSKNKIIRNPNHFVDIINTKYLLKIILSLISKSSLFKCKSININATSNQSIKISTLIDTVNKIKKNNKIKINQANNSNNLQYLGRSNIIMYMLKLNKFNILDNIKKFIKSKKYFKC